MLVGVLAEAASLPRHPAPPEVADGRGGVGSGRPAEREAGAGAGAAVQAGLGHLLRGQPQLQEEARKRCVFRL